MVDQGEWGGEAGMVGSRELEELRESVTSGSVWGIE